MARDFSGSSQSITGTGPTIVGSHTIAIWGDGDDWSQVSNDFGVCGLFAAKGTWGGDANGDTRLVEINGVGLRFVINTSSGEQVATGAALTGGTAHYLAGVYDEAASDMFLYLDGSVYASNTSVAGTLSNNAAGLAIGAFPNNLAGTEFDGRMAEAAIWDVALSAAEVAILAKGYSPLLVRPQNLIWYMPIIGKHSTEPELIGGLGGTVTGATASNHPRVFYPSAKILGVPGPPVVSAAITGTAGDGATEAEIVAGGETIIITLTNDTWVASGGTFDGIRQDIIDGLDSAQVEATGWNAEVRDKQGVSGVVRTSDTVVTITLDAQAAYNITATETITVTVPGSAVTGASPITATPTFNVTAAAAGGVGPLIGGKLIGGGILAGRLVR